MLWFFRHINQFHFQKKRVHFQSKLDKVDYVPNAKIVRDAREDLSSTETLFKPTKSRVPSPCRMDKMPESLKIQLDPLQHTRAELEQEIHREYLWKIQNLSFRFSHSTVI